MDDSVPLVDVNGGIRSKRSKIWKEAQIIILVVIVVATGSANRVSSKIVSETMREYNFFLGALNGAAYCFLYGIILFTRYKSGIVPKDHISYVWNHKYEPTSGGFFMRAWQSISPIKYFILMGLMDGLGNILGLIAQPYVNGDTFSLMSQTIIIFSMICALIILRTRYTYWQIWSAFIVISGATISIIPVIKHSVNAQFAYAVLTALSTLPNAISFTIKEHVFNERKKEGLDIFVVNTHASLFQLLLQPIFLPLAFSLNPSIKQDVWTFVTNAVKCFFLSETPVGTLDPPLCQYNPTPYIIYICFNLTFNITLLILLKRASALLSFMAIKAVLPLTVVLFCFRWVEFLDPIELVPETVVGLITILLGIGLYRITTMMKKANDQECCSCMIQPL